ncbi:hypothetical protein GCM10025865_09490 [Paraoerskovia sediminicola]|uniref:Sortase family protein n=1 Tax=Paraoerskovia sediminicola TaxID=1138587 RepID=A0ABN6X9T4_9CELL|nr:class F sortase [Paraoerskovia sediminicola]BDZ41650.1 hypothetical protein GCM10025865_09490 [Paraoerskovia sediminicola]
MTDAAGETHKYTVKKIERVPKADIPLDTVFDRDGDPRLVLVTCGGDWDAGTGHYVDNVVVTAVPVAGAG